MWVAILKLLLFGVFEMRTIIIVYQARYSALHLNSELSLDEEYYHVMFSSPSQCNSINIFCSSHRLTAIFPDCSCRYAQESSGDGGLQGLRQRLNKVHIRFYFALFTSIFVAFSFRQL